jgi:hypothetical protein
MALDAGCRRVSAALRRGRPAFRIRRSDKRRDGHRFPWSSLTTRPSSAGRTRGSLVCPVPEDVPCVQAHGHERRQLLAGFEVQQMQEAVAVKILVPHNQHYRSTSTPRHSYAWATVSNDRGHFCASRSAEGRSRAGGDGTARTGFRRQRPADSQTSGHELSRQTESVKVARRAIVTGWDRQTWRREPARRGSRAAPVLTFLRVQSDDNPLE